MDIKFSKDDDSAPQGVVEEKGKQNVLLVVLLILVAGFGYVYFFTGLIKPAQEQKVAEAPPVPQVIKKPLPLPDGEPTKAATAVSEPKNDVVPSTKPEPVKAAPASAPVAAAKPVVQEAAKPKENLKMADTVQPAVRKPLPVVGKDVEKKVAAVEKKQPVAAEKKPSVTRDAEKKTASAKKPVEKPVAVVAAQPKKEVQKPDKKVSAVSGVGAASGLWTVLVGNYVLEEAMAADLARVRSAGFQANIVSGAHKKTIMNRLLLAEFTDRPSAQAELDKLKRYTSDAFMIDNNGMHLVYAGSYLLDERASSEKQRLAAAGFNLAVKRVSVFIPTKNITAGSFADKSAAEDVLKKLKAAGVKSTLSR